MIRPSERAVRTFEDFEKILMEMEGNSGAEVINAMHRSGKEAQTRFDAWFIKASRARLVPAVDALSDTRLLRPDHRIAMNADLVEQLRMLESAYQKWSQLVAMARDIKKLPQLVMRIERYRRKN